MDQTYTVEGRRVRWTSRLDEASADFERELLGPRGAHELCDPHVGLSTTVPLSLPLQQTHAWLEHTDEEFRLFQMRDAKGAPAMQVVAYLERSRYMPFAATANAFKIGRAVSPEEEAVGLRVLRAVGARADELLSLRLQPRRIDLRSLLDFEARARRAGFSLVDPVSVTRTLVVDLLGDDTALSAALPQKTRVKIRHRTRSEVVIRPLTDETHRNACLEASLASARRHGGRTTRVRIKPILALSRTRPETCAALGLFLKERPAELLAFACAQRHGLVAEYVSAGSFGDPELRKLPFNYFLIWELMNWARQGGSRFLDLGGVTDGGSDDPLAGVSEFKRHLTPPRPRSVASS